MLPKHLLLLALVASLQSAHAVVDLTPTPQEYTAEGITIQQLIFRDGKQRVSYEPPRRWAYRFDAGALTLTPPKVDRAEAVVQAMPLLPPQPLDSRSIAVAKQQFIAALPPGSQMVEIAGEEFNPVVVDENTSYAVTASYQTLGETFTRCTVFINIRDTQLRFQLTARKADFAAVNAAFRRSMMKLRWLPAAELMGGVEPK